MPMSSKLSVSLFLSTSYILIDNPIVDKTAKAKANAKANAKKAILKNVAKLAKSTWTLILHAYYTDLLPESRSPTSSSSSHYSGSTTVIDLTGDSSDCETVLDFSHNDRIRDAGRTPGPNHTSHTSSKSFANVEKKNDNYDLKSYLGTSAARATTRAAAPPNKGIVGMHIYMVS